MKKLGIVSASALMLLGVGAGMSNAQRPVHADGVLQTDLVRGDAQNGWNYDVYTHGGVAGAKAYDKVMAKKNAEIAKENDEPSEHEVQHHNSTYVAPVAHQATVKPAKHARHHVAKRSLKHDTVYVNRVNRKRHARKHIVKRVHNVKRQARHARKNNKRANLQRKIRGLKRQLRRART